MLRGDARRDRGVEGSSRTRRAPRKRGVHWSSRSGEGLAPFDPECALLALVRDAVGDDAAWEPPAALLLRNRVLIVRNDAPTIERIVTLLDPVGAAGDLRAHVETYAWSTVTGAAPASLGR